MREKGINVPRYNAYGRAVPDPNAPVEIENNPLPDIPQEQLEIQETEPESIEQITIEITTNPKQKQKKNEKQKETEKDSLKRLFEDDSDTELKQIAPRAKHTKKTTQKLAKQISLEHENQDSFIMLLCTKCCRRIMNLSMSLNVNGNTNGKVCEACLSIPKLKKKVIKVLLSERCEVPTLQFTCIQIISKYITSIEEVIQKFIIILNIFKY